MIAALIVSAVLAAPLVADDTAMRVQEQVRFEGFHDSAGRAILQAMSDGARGDVDWLQEALSGEPVLALETTLSGEWECRTLKLGGAVPLVVYAPFRCVFAPDGSAFTFEKVSGSQRMIGRVTLQDRKMIYLGVGYVADAEPMDYADLPMGDFGDGTYQPQVGVVEQTGPNTARILFPAPLNESLFDVLYLTRDP